MNLSISNIAWSSSEDQEVYCLMREYGYKGLEIAPGRIWNMAESTVNRKEITFFRDQIHSIGLHPVAFQSLLYGKPELKIFEGEEVRAKTLNYLKKIVNLASACGTGILVFGSPKNRNIGLPYQNTASDIAVNFFRKLGDYAISRSVIVCIEPNPAVYKTNFINNLNQAEEFVVRVNSEGFRLHLDTGAMILNGESPLLINGEMARTIAHAHISEPFLEPVFPAERLEFHQELAVVLSRQSYNGWISIEMKSNPGDSNLKNVEVALKKVASVYQFIG